MTFMMSQLSQPIRQWASSLRRRLTDTLNISLFSPFDPKLPPPRCHAPLSSLYHLDYIRQELRRRHDAPPTLTLGCQRFTFQRGRWVAEGDDAGRKVHEEALRRKIRRLREENDVLKMKVELLMDMMTKKKTEAEKPAETHERNTK